MVSLDCVTPRGQIYISHQADCLARLAARWNCDIYSTAENAAADIDAIAVRAARVSAVLEIKSREMSLPQLKSFGSYLITYAKLVKMCEMSSRLCVPSFLVVSLLADQSIVYWKISDADGQMTILPECRESRTQTTCNGGQIVRCNAYIPLDQMKIL